MAKKPYRPGRTLINFFIGVVLAFGLVALSGTSWTPELGLDLQGGTRIQLTAKGTPSTESLDEARKIIDQRVNGSGVSEAEVTTASGQYIVVEIPGKKRKDLLDTVERQAQLRFRLVGCVQQCTAAPTTDPNAPVPPVPTQTLPATTEPGAPNTKAPKTNAPKQSSTANRPPVGFDEPGAAPTDKPKPTKTPGPTTPAAPETTPAAPETTAPAPSADGSTDEGFVAPLDGELAWMNGPDAASVELFNSLSCATDGQVLGPDGKPAPQSDDSATPLVACQPQETGSDGEKSGPFKYLLSQAVIQGTDLKDASSGTPQNGVGFQVNLKIGGKGSDVFYEVSQALVQTDQQFAIVLDGTVISAPTMEGTIANGDAQITGSFTETQAASLATSLKFGALPIAFTDEPLVELIGPSLAGDQLSAGLLAGLIGLGLVMLYCLIYYRGLGLVVIASLLMAAAVTYAMVLLLSEAANFTLTLPGIAGLIVAVGITADSFIVFFERIRDEMRDGKSMRVAVESGWVRARNTCLAADAVSLLAALVLYIFAVGVVKGFAFALGISTLIDIVVFFWFTKPMVSVLARRKFFNQGHSMSGLDAEALGVDSINLGQAKTVGGRA